MAYHLERGGTPLHCAVGVNCEKAAANENQGEVSSVWAKWCTLGICACINRLDMTNSPCWRENLMLLNYYLKYNSNRYNQINNNNIIYHDFLPTPRRGSHVKSGKNTHTHTQSSRYTP